MQKIFSIKGGDLEHFLRRINKEIADILEKPLCERDITVEDAVTLFKVDGVELFALLGAADELRKRSAGDQITFVHNRNINFTNYCVNKCLFCCFRQRPGENKGYCLNPDEIISKAGEAFITGATEICMQGGLNPELSPSFYFNICQAIKNSFPSLHIHAFSPMEVYFAARKNGMSVREFLKALKSSGLDSMPGTAAEILDDSIRKIICPEKINRDQWIEVITAAHESGIPSSATMMYGHIEKPYHIAIHLNHIREIQKNTGGFTEFVPLSFVYPNTELNRRRIFISHISGIMEMKVFAISRLMLNKYIKNIQVSWTKLGIRLAQICLCAGGNDIGGTLMEENISRLAGSQSPNKMSIDELVGLVRSIGRIPVERSTVYDILKVYSS